MVRFTDARIKSNDIPDFPSSSGRTNRLFILFRIDVVTSLFTALFVSTPQRTMDLDNGVDENLSNPLPWRARLTSVSVTVLAFLENHNASTIIIPAARSIFISAFTGPFSDSIYNVSMEPPAAEISLACLNASNPASGTPMKFTRSLLAKASARAMVPINTIIFRILILNTNCKMAIITVHPANVTNNDLAILDSIISRKSVTINGLPLNPLNTIK